MTGRTDSLRLPVVPDRPVGAAGGGFRDPPPTADRRRALKQAIARAIAAAPSLPTDLPIFDMRLLDVDAEADAITLVIGKEDPMAALRISVDAGAFSARVEPAALCNLTRDHQSRLDEMARRLRVALREERWREARAAADELLRTPADVPAEFWRQLVAGSDEGVTGLVRVGFRCNQDCGMCWQGRDWGNQDAAVVLGWIEDLRAAGAEILIVSGGEPTLDRALPDYVRRARELGFGSVVLETNAVLASKPGRAEELARSGLTSAFVSLHSSDAATSDAITRAPGTHERTVRGTRALLDAGINVRLNAVATAEGLDRLPSLPSFVARELGNHPNLESLMISYPTMPHDRSLTSKIVPPPNALRSALTETIEQASELGVPLANLGGPCGPQLCAFDADRRAATLAPIEGPVDFRRYVPECDRCAVRTSCFGVRDIDVEMFASECARPLSRAP